MLDSSARLALPQPLAQQLRSSGLRIIVTGGGGWIGQAILEMLDQVFGDELQNHVLVFGSSARDLYLRSGRTISCRLIEAMRTLSHAPSLFFHCAFLTKDRLQDQSVDAFIAGNQAISDAVADAMQQGDLRGLFMPSSGAVYRKGTHELDDNLQANPYGVMKHQDELRFLNIAKAAQVPACIPRLFNLSGPFINKVELYALASMITSCVTRQEITIRAPHRVVRSYIHVADLVALGFSMLLNPQINDTPIFDTVGDVEVELSELAQEIKTTLHYPMIPIQRPDIVEGKDDRYVGDGRIFKAMMMVHGLTPHSLSAQIQSTATYLSTLAS